ncbi:MAG: hypothetical protein ILA25_07160 [Prevotella sp.]|nr:hypothetical protein [Prevotella sp.]
MTESGKKICQNVCGIREKIILLQAVIKNEKTMNMLNAYFYGFYFYFAADCEAEGRM